MKIEKVLVADGSTYVSIDMIHVHHNGMNCSKMVGCTVVVVQAMETHEGSGGITTSINLGIRWRKVVCFTPPLPGTEKTRRYPLKKRLGGSENRSECPAEKKNLPLQGLERLRLRTDPSLVTTPTE